MKQKFVAILAFALLGSLIFGFTSPVYADATIVVNSTADDTDDDGECTLREAINTANDNTASGVTAGECVAGDAGHDTITFNISGSRDFTNNGEDGYIIKPQSALPQITEQLTINGYSQPGAQANTAPAPNPLNGILLIELDGSDLTAGSGDGFSFVTGSNNSAVRGLIVGGFDENDAFKIGVDNIQIQGNYIGVDHTGMTANPNEVGINGTSSTPRGEDALVGGLDPEDRNIISGNTAGNAATGSYPYSGWVMQGNYVGVGSDGLTPIANSTVGGSGSFSVDHAEGVVIGGPEPTAINVIGASLGHGLAPLNADDLLIENNFIGLGYDGVTVLGSLSNGQGSGIALSEGEHVTIKNNRVAGWRTGGISINPGNSNVIVEGNIAHSNRGNVSISGSSGVSVINNTVYNSTAFSNIAVTGFSGVGIFADAVSVQGNKVGYLVNGDPAPNNDTIGVAIMGDPTNVLIGGVAEDDGNKITEQSGAGIAVMKLTVNAMSASLTPQKVSVLGNTVTKTNGASSFLLNAPGLGIDLLEGVDTDSSPDGAPNTLIDQGVTANDTDDSDIGPNNFINFPVLNSVSQEGGQAKINFDLNAADSPTDEYRVEFFANDQADSSGHGEGQIFLGATTVTNGANQQATLMLPGGISLAGKSISATTTAIDSTTDSGFGGTSEFSRAVVVPGADDNKEFTLADTGINTYTIILIAVSSLAISGTYIFRSAGGAFKS